MINFLAWWQRIINLACFANNVIHPWPQMVLIFDREMPPRFTPAICLHCNLVYISTLETNPSTKTSKILFWIVRLVTPTFGKSCHRPWLHGLKNQCLVGSSSKLSKMAADTGLATHWIICQFLKAENVQYLLAIWCLGPHSSRKPLVLWSVASEITVGPVKHASTLVRRASEEFCGTILSFHVMW